MIGVKSIALRKKAGAQSEYDRELGWFRTDNQRKGVSWLENYRKEALRAECFLLNLSNSILAKQG